MDNNAWSTYFKLVYGAIPSSAYPDSPDDLWMFYSDLISQAGVRDYPESIGNCPKDGRDAGQVNTTNNAYTPSGTFWAWHPYPYTAIRSNGLG